MYFCCIIIEKYDTNAGSGTITSSYAFTVTGQTLTFTAAPVSGTNNIQIYQLNNINTLNTIADNTVTSAKIQDGSIARVDLAFDPEDDATALAIALG